MKSATIKLNAGSVEGKDIGKGGIDQLADRFGEIDHLVEHLLDIRCKGGLETGKKRGVRNFREAAEVPQFPAEDKKKNEQRVCRDRKDFLKDKGGKETFQRIDAFPSESQVKGMVKISGDELGNVKSIIKKLEKGRGIFLKHILTV